jgi:5'-nucleotidase/UDP-sugar diphosphatase
MLNSGSDPQKTRINLLFTSDEHGYTSRQTKLQQKVDATRAENPEGTLLISCGDVFEGSAETGVLGVDASRQMLETAGYDLMTLGNHDFDRGVEVTRDWVKNSPIPIVVSNVRDSESSVLREGTSGSKVVELDGTKVGFVGVTTPDTEKILPKNKLQGISFQDPVASVREEVRKLQASGIQVIGLISHLGLPADREMARQVPGLDFILGGHTHDAHREPEYQGSTLIAHPGCFRESLGHLELSVDKATGSVESKDYELVSAEGKSDHAGAVGELASEYQQILEEAMGATIARIPSEIEFDPNGFGEGMESVFSRAVAEATGADVVVVNQKGIRAGLSPGDVKVQDIFNVMPFDNRVLTADMKVSELLALQQESINRSDQTSFISSDQLLQLATDCSSRKLIIVESSKSDFQPINRDDSEALEKMWHPDAVSEDQIVTVATLDFLTQGGLGFFKSAPEIKDDHGTARDVLQNYLASHY